MHKRKYTKEQLEFYFKKLMERLKRIPREEDLNRFEGYPSVKAYADRFGSWQNAIDMFANFDLAKKKCINCAKILIRKKKTQKFCSKKCQREFYSKKFTRYTSKTDNKIRSLLGDCCFVCDFDTLVEIHSLDSRSESNTALLKAYNKKDMTGFVLLCPNHHQMVHKKIAKIHKRNNEIIWEE